MHLGSLWNAVDCGHRAEAVWRWGLSMCTTNDVKVFCQPGFSQSLRQSSITARLLEATVWERPVVSTFTPLWGSQNIEGIPGADLWFCFHWRHFFIPWTLMLLGDLNKHYVEQWQEMSRDSLQNYTAVPAKMQMQMQPVHLLVVDSNWNGSM